MQALTTPDRTLTHSVVDDGDAPPGPLRLIVLAGDALESFPIPDSGEMVLGRAKECDVRIDSGSISRRHALIKIGFPLMVEDLGSSNGTRVRTRLLKKGESSEIAPGDVIEMGPVMVIVQRASAASPIPRPRRLWSHGYFEARVEEEAERAERTGAPFSVVRVRLEGTAAPLVVEEVLAERTRPSDVVAAYGPGEYELLLADYTPQASESFARQLLEELARRAAPVRTGVACYPRDGRSADVLVAQACSAVLGETDESKDREAKPVVRDPGMQKIQELLRRVAKGPISILLLGETGVGKEIYAEMIHRMSPRANKPFLRLNCAALSESLLESELFGHEKGAFTGAMKAKAGLLESAAGGTVLLDEVGELPAAIQVKLLRVLEQREVLRVGELKPRPIDVRFISATNRDLDAEVQRGNFRQDLFFRLNGFSLTIPPLRDRAAEIEPLAKAFITAACRQLQRTPEPSLSPEALHLLRRYVWPGNIRELRNVMERAVLLCDQTILVEHLPVEKMKAAWLSEKKLDSLAAGFTGVNAPQPSASQLAESTAPGTVSSPLLEEDRKRILDALAQSGGNQTLTAKLLGISRGTLLSRLDLYAIPRPRKAGTPKP
jgi:two-component system, NtrC family, response regulator AtoC